MLSSHQEKWEKMFLFLQFCLIDPKCKLSFFNKNVSLRESEFHAMFVLY